ncbi:MAG TPA: hypothetical protein VMB77_13415 [Syntrophales bacterium]|nr:hypothetical protein [Syntrophales bacterium]
MEKRRTKTKAEKSRDLLHEKVALYLFQCWEQAKLPSGNSDRKNFEKAAKLVVDFMDWHRIEESEIKFIKDKFFPTFLRVAKVQPAGEVSTRLLLTMGPDILNSTL